MSEIHLYNVTVSLYNTQRSSLSEQTVTERAYSADDAVAQVGRNHVFSDRVCGFRVRPHGASESDTNPIYDRLDRLEANREADRVTFQYLSNRVMRLEESK